MDREVAITLSFSLGRWEASVEFRAGRHDVYVTATADELEIDGVEDVSAIRLPSTLVQQCYQALERAAQWEGVPIVAGERSSYVHRHDAFGVEYDYERPFSGRTPDEWFYALLGLPDNVVLSKHATLLEAFEAAEKLR
jgi:hypothetical protein